MIKRLPDKMIEITWKRKQETDNPFWSVELRAVFTHKESGTAQTVHGFYDGRNEEGEDVFKIRWMPQLSGTWFVEPVVTPAIDGWSEPLTLEIKEQEVYTRGFLRTKEGKGWGLRFDNGEPFYLLGDTIYNLFGGHYCGVGVKEILCRRRQQGVNYIRARMQVSPSHPGIGNSWQNKDCWPWGCSAQSPDFMSLNLDYFRAVDEVLSLAEELDMGVEIIMEAWMAEFPFNDRGKFITEFEELWLKYIVSRFASYPSVFIWCPANEYEFYPDGAIKYHPEADRWLKRIAAYIKNTDPYKHPVGVHNWEQKVPVNERFGNCSDIDVYLVQTDWCNELEKYDWKKEASLCMGLEQQVKFHAQDSEKVIICDEFGYEKAEGCFTFPAHELLDHHHTRRGQWRAAFSGFPAVHGFNNTWGPHMRIDKDAIGAGYLIHLYRFMTEKVKFYEMQEASALIRTATGSAEEGTLPLCLADDTLCIIAIYFPVKGECQLSLPVRKKYKAFWYNPRTGDKKKACDCDGNRFASPESGEGNDINGDDWVLTLQEEKKE